MLRTGTKSNRKLGLSQKIFATAGVPVVAGLLVLSILSTSTGVAVAIESLPHIEWWAEQLREGDEFRILELIPDTEVGIFGYYVAGQEPGRAYNWEQRLAGQSDPPNDPSGEPSETERRRYMAALKAEMDDSAGGTNPDVLQDGANVLGYPPADGIDDYPVTWLGEYDEQYPWQWDVNEDWGTRPHMADAERLVIKETKYDDVHVRDVGAGNGHFIADKDYTPFNSPHTEDDPRLKISGMVYSQDPNATGGELDTFKYYFKNMKFAGEGLEVGLVSGGPTGVQYTNIMIDARVLNSEVGNLLGYGDAWPDWGDPEWDDFITSSPSSLLPPGFTGAVNQTIFDYDNNFWYKYIGNGEWEQYFVRIPVNYGTPFFLEVGGYYQYEGLYGTDNFSISSHHVVYDFGTGNYWDYKNDSAPPDPITDGYYIVTNPAYDKRLNDADFDAVTGNSPKNPANYPLGARFIEVLSDDLVYVGPGKGDYIYDPGSAVVKDVIYDHIYFTGGFENNNWFLRHVLDRPGAPGDNLDDYLSGVIVNTIKDDNDSDPDAVMSILEYISQADMIVLREGVTLTDAQAAAVYNMSIAPRYIPVMFDHALASDDTPAGKLVRNLAEKTPDAPGIGSMGELPGGGAINGYDSEGDLKINGVNDNIFWTSLAAKDLLRELASFTVPPDEFDAVKEEIDYENFLRMVQERDDSEMLPKMLSGATSVRYIINFSGRRIENRWEHINVLEIQGGLTYPGSGDFGISDLTEEKIRAWIGDTVEPYQVKTISITRMTTYEFVGKIEDLNEKYHMIYIGGTARGMNEATAGNGISRYNDSSMNGLVYTNIGDRYSVGSVGDAAALQGLVTGDTDRRFRLSGNDITPPKMKDLLDFVDAGYPIIVDDRLVRDDFGTKHTVTATVVRGTGTNYNFSVTGVPAGADIQWTSNAPGFPGSSASSFTFTAGTSMGNGTHYNVYCSVGYNGLSRMIGPLTISRSGGTYSVISGSSSGVFTELRPDEDIADIDLNVNADRVDNSSNIYSALDRILSKRNGYSETLAELDRSTVARFLNLSKPILNLKDYPLRYNMDAAGNMNYMGTWGEDNTLSFTFDIYNLTEAFPQSTTYTVELFLDLDGDGRYTGTEKQTDIVVSGGSASGLRAETDYTVTKLMPKDAVGLYDWCLKITRNDGKGNVRASETGYTRIRPDPENENSVKTIHILQIASSLISDGSSFSYKGGQQRTNFEWQQRTKTTPNGNEGYLRGKDGLYYEGIYGKLMADVDDFDIRVYTVYADELDNLSRVRPISQGGTRPDNAGTQFIGYVAEKLGGGEGLVFASDLKDIFEVFDMLIIGFDDSYGTLSERSAEAIAHYINSGKATLFAHDAVTFYNNPSASGAYGIDAAFILRNATSLDRYGLTNPNFFSKPYGGGSLSADTAQRLLDAQYSVGWTPKSDRGSTVRDIQGFNYHVLKWFNGGANTYNSFMNTNTAPSGGENYGEGAYNGSGNPMGRRTTRVTQLNDGKITTYPYDVNIPIGASANVGETHGQYYTVNMNLDNIAVWYCLYSPYYIYNDAANGYYIYNSGNVTYTGAGHSMTQGTTTGRDTSRGSANISEFGGTNTFGTNHSGGDYGLSAGIEFEAKLFVNTMIAAYRAGREDPAVRVTDTTGLLPIKIHLLPADGSLLTSELISDRNKTIFFTVSDGNLSAQKTISLSLSYHVGEFPEEFVTTPQGTTPDPATSPYLTCEEVPSRFGEFRNSLPPPYVSMLNGPGGNHNGSLQTGNVYSFTLPDEVLNELSDPDIDSVTIRLKALTSIPLQGSGAYERKSGYTNLVLRKLDLFELS